jgi:hypothetical protein
MSDAFRRYFKIIIGIAGALVSGVLVLSGLSSGSAPGLSRTSAVAGVAFQRATQGSQYWFIILLWSVACVFFVWLAWLSYRE